MTRRIRSAFAILLCLLVVGLQQEVQRHALSHFARYAGALEQAAPTPPEVTCAECALLAAASAALVADAKAPACHPGSSEAPVGTQSVRASSRPSYYRSRAPPALS